MKNRSVKIILCIIVLLVVAGGVTLGIRVANHGRDIIGVTTLPSENLVIMNSANGEEFVSGTGSLTVGEGEKAHLTYRLSGGSFDLTLSQGEEIRAEQEGISGSGELDLEVDSGEYEVTFLMHGAIGTARVGTSKR